MGRFGKPFNLEQLSARYQEQVAAALHRTIPAYARTDPATAAASVVGSPSHSKLEPAFGYAPAVKTQPQAAYPARVRIRITSHRCGILCDPDNVAAKYFVDCCRYARLLRDDTNGQIDLEVKETRVSTRKEEGTLIEIFPL